MATTILGNTGIEVTPIGFGTWAWGDSLFWGYGKDYGEMELRQAFQAAVNKGITFLDTAEVYGLGKSEQLIGKFVKESSATTQIATKYMPLPWRFRKEDVADAVTASLKRLRMPSIDLYQVHFPAPSFLSQEGLMDALADEVEQGRIKAVGVSNYSAQQLREAHRLLARRGVPLAVNQMRYSLITREIETNGVLAAARELNVTILAYSPLAQGLLTGKYTAGNPPTGARSLDKRFQTVGLQKIQPVLNKLAELGDKYSKTPAQVALNWLMCQPGVIPIPGIKTATQVEQNAGAMGWELSAEEVMELRYLS
ncbi:aldo/keto reductase [Chamaesiphon polymorphus]|uniref:2,5-didehydrogluconate reductase n=1 Tax=Chamaesiphon polymorphus CCALA 037 TaxID=2107692 RepID=A0A2T1GNB0_9CYAN|nr:aldo/keto reductase [Chamaesiphon polymorphus]PSB59405.1 2,5-didehydrogluconate reductase [Chamaesiphon polymorphus CCALA 037]